jgi:2-keto-4-pentenoate hydratase
MEVGGAYAPPVPPIDPSLVRALERQQRSRDAALRRGAQRIGWKLGLGDRESIGGHIAVGYLTSETMLAAGSSYAAAHDADLHADAEALVELGEGIEPAATTEAVARAIAHYGAALEIVDLAPVAGGPAAVVAENVFHRAVAMTTWTDEPSPTLEVGLSVNGHNRATDTWPTDLLERLVQAAGLLAAVGERIAPGDRIIMGSIVQTPIAIGDEVTARFGDAASLRLVVTSE